MRFPSAFVSVVPLVFCCCETFAATEFTTTVPEGLLREFTGGTALSDLPDDFPEFLMPEGMLTIGSQQMPGQQMVLLRTLRGGSESQLAIVNALKADGGNWMELAPPGSGRQTGFVVAARASESVTLCHDQHGIFEIHGEDGIENRVYIRRYNMMNDARSPTCAEQNESRLTHRPPVRPGISPLMQYMPSFEALMPPVDASAATDTSTRTDALRPPLNEPQIGIRGIPGSRIDTVNRGFFPRLAVVGRVGAAGLVDSRDAPQFNAFIAVGGRSLRTFRREVASAMKAQGWQLDSEWSNSDTAASHWLRDNTEGKRILLRVNITLIPEGFYNVVYGLDELGN